MVSFVVYFKTPVTVNEGLAKLRDVVDNNKMLGNFTVEALKIIQPVNPTTAVSTEGSTSTVCTSTQRGNLINLYNHDVDDDKNVKIAIVFMNNMKFQQINHRIKKKERTKETFVAMVESGSRQMNPDINPRKMYSQGWGLKRQQPVRNTK